MLESSKVASKEAVYRTMRALEPRNIATHLVDNGEQALEKLVELVPRQAEVYISTSATLDTIGYTTFMKENPDYTNLTEGYQSEADPVKKRELLRRVLTSDYYIGSVQAIAETGEVFVASASGSQLAPYVFGPSHVIWVVGTQKIAPTFEDAIERTRGYTLEQHHRWMEGRGSQPIPIGKLGIIENEREPGRTTLILINESLGW